jgi:hypothetical protein
MNWQFALRRITQVLPDYAYSFGDEKQFHDGLEIALRGNGLPFTREYVAGPQDRFDFFCENGVVIEAKIKGSLSEALRQVDRYCQRDDVSAVVIVTTRLWGSTARLKPDAELHGKPVRLVAVRGQAF